MNEEIERERLTRRFLQLIEAVYLQARPSVPEEWSDTDVTMPQFRIITLLSIGPHKVSDIAAHLGINPSSATSVVDRLVNKGLVERHHDPGNRRVIWCQLTPLGRQEVRRFWHISVQRLESAANNLSLEEIRTLVNALKILEKMSPYGKEAKE